MLCSVINDTLFIKGDINNLGWYYNLVPLWGCCVCRLCCWLVLTIAVLAGVYCVPCCVAGVCLYWLDSIVSLLLTLLVPCINSFPTLTSVHTLIKSCVPAVLLKYNRKNNF